MKRLVLIDGHAVLHRAYHAFPKNLTTRKKGELVNAVYGFTKMLLKVVEDLKPNYLVVTFDLPKPTFRNKLYIGYQHKRPKTDIELINQIKRVHQVVETLNIPIFEVPGFEADDVIGTLAKKASQKNVQTIIFTGDRDIMQLVTNKVKVYSPIRGLSNTELFDKKKVKKLLGVWPKQIIDYKALVGDSSDNYPGVPGIGPITAVQLLKEYKDFKTIYQNIKKLKPNTAKKLSEGRQSALLSRRLAKIVTNVPVKLNLKDCKIHDYNQEKVIKLFQELEFKSLIKKLPHQEEKINKKEDKQIKLL